MADMSAGETLSKPLSLKLKTQSTQLAQIAWIAKIDFRNSIIATEKCAESTVVKFKGRGAL